MYNTAPAWISLRFLYSHLPGTLHYTLAYFQRGGACERQNRGGFGREQNGKWKTAIPNPGTEFQIQSS